MAVIGAGVVDLWGGRRALGDRVKLAVFSQDLAQARSCAFHRLPVVARDGAAAFEVLTGIVILLLASVNINKK